MKSSLRTVEERAVVRQSIEKLTNYIITHIRILGNILVSKKVTVILQIIRKMKHEQIKPRKYIRIPCEIKYYFHSMVVFI